MTEELFKAVGTVSDAKGPIQVSEAEVIKGTIRCPKCKYISGDDWEQCNGKCPMEGSPHYVPPIQPPTDELLEDVEFYLEAFSEKYETQEREYMRLLLAALKASLDKTQPKREDLIAALAIEQAKTKRLFAALEAAEAQLSERSMEADVGKWVYSRIDALMDVKSGTAEAVELSYLTSAVGHVEEYGVENCEGHDLGGDALRAAEAENTRLREALANIETGLTCRNDGAHYCPNCDNSLWDERAAARRALGGGND